MHTHDISDADRQFLRDFEAFAVSPADFNHEAHVRLAYVYLAEAGVESAVERMRDALVAFLAHHQLPPSKFHETLTRSWILAVNHFMNKAGSASSSDFIARHPALLDGKIMLTHYSAQVLFSDEARAAFIEPDLDPIPR